MSPTKGEGDISFGADPGRRHRRDSLYPPYFLSQWKELYQTCMEDHWDKPKELFKFW